MSASEKLRALAKEQEREGRFPQLPDYEGDIYLAALPLIADVVEAVERATEYAQEPDARKAAGVLRAEVASSLTALREHLEGQ